MYKEWIVEADQWIQEYWTYDNGTMTRVIHDNKDGSHDETHYSVEKFTQEYQQYTTAPFPEIFDFLKTLP